MKYYKYWSSYAKVAGIKSNTYDRRLSSINEWAAEAKRDIPSLEDEEIKVVQYLGDRWNKQLGIEFSCGKCPKGYEEIEQLEMAFS